MCSKRKCLSIFMVALCIYVLVFIYLFIVWYEGRLSTIYIWDDTYLYDLSIYLKRALWVIWEINGGEYSPQSQIFGKLPFIAPFYVLFGERFQIFFISFALALTVLFYYIMIREYIKSHLKHNPNTKYLIIAVALGLYLYIFNVPNIVYTFTFHKWYILNLFGFPLLVLCILKIYSNKYYLVFLPIILTLNLVDGIKIWPSVVLVGFTFLFYILYRVFGLKQSIKYTLIVAVLVLLSTAFLWLPHVYSTKTPIASYTGSKNMTTYLKIAEIRQCNSTILNAFLGVGMSEWWSNQWLVSINPFLAHKSLVVFNIIPYIIISIAILLERSFVRSNIYLFIMLLLSILLLAPLHSFIAPLWRTIYVQHSVFAIFDIPYANFGLMYEFFLSILTSLAIYLILLRVSGVNKRIIVVILLVISVILSSIGAAGLITGKFIPDYAKVEFPSWYDNLVKFINSLSPYDRVLIFPPVPTLAFVNWSHGYLGNYIIMFKTDKDLVGSYVSTVERVNKLVSYIRTLHNIKQMLYWGDLFSGYLDLNVTYIVPVKVYSRNHTVLKLWNLKFFTERGGIINITFIGNPVGLIDVNLFELNDTHVIKYLNMYKKYYNSSEISFLIHVPPNSLIEPRVYLNSNTSIIKIGFVNSSMELPYGFQYVGALKLLGINYVVLRKDVISHPRLPYKKFDYDDIEKIFNYLLRKVLEINGTITIYEVPQSYDKIYFPSILYFYNYSKVRIGEYYTKPYAKIIKPPCLIRNKCALIQEKYKPLILKYFNSTWYINEINEYKVIKISPVEWIVEVNASKPFILVFLYNFDSNWNLAIYKEGRLVSNKAIHIPVNLYANAWIINVTGKLTIHIKYNLQEYYNLSIIVSLTSILVILMLALYLKLKEWGSSGINGGDNN